MPSSGMPTERLVTLNGSGGAFVTINFSIPARKVQIEEAPPADGVGAFAAQGIAYQTAEDNFATTKTVKPSGQINMGDIRGTGGQGPGNIIGWPAQSPASGGSNNKAADSIGKFRSPTATPTTIVVREFA